jgi:hydroxymethylglutaryl-CoA lyase
MFKLPARHIPVLSTSSRGFATVPTSSKFVRMLECGARDGLQNEKAHVSTEIKADFIQRLAATGLNYIEAGAFVSPKW